MKAAGKLHRWHKKFVNKFLSIIFGKTIYHLRYHWVVSIVAVVKGKRKKLVYLNFKQLERHEDFNEKPLIAVKF